MTGICVDLASSEPEIGERPVIRDGQPHCPKCGTAAESGYGLMGGGVGGYEFCVVDGCCWFHKVMDPDDDTRFDADGYPKRTARKGEKRCGECAKFALHKAMRGRQEPMCSVRLSKCYARDCAERCARFEYRMW